MAKKDKRNALSDEQLENASGGTVFSHHSIMFTDKDADKALKWARDNGIDVKSGPPNPPGPAHLKGKIGRY